MIENCAHPPGDAPQHSRWSTCAHFLAGPFASAWQHREILARLTRREVEMRFQGSLFGLFWVFASPLVYLGAYTLVFGLIIRPQWQGEIKDHILIALVYFLCLVIFDFFMECVAAAPNLIRQNKNFVKKVVFPVEILPWVVLGHGIFRLLIGFSLGLLAHLLLRGLPPIGLLISPLVIFPLGLITLGLVWIISALATYFRDIGHVVQAFLPIMMFVSPIFFPLSAMPPAAQAALLINPTSFPLEAVRQAIFGFWFDNWFGLGVYWLIAFAVAILGHRIFMHLRPSFSDVI